MAEEAVYHNRYMKNFRLAIPNENWRGFPANQIMIDNFKRVSDMLEDEADS